MASVNDLLKVANEPNSLGEWLDRFSPEDREVVEDAMRRHKPSQIYPILRSLDDNPFPFSAGAISGWRRRSDG